jgi:ADP-ribose pyrophosphatase
MSEDLKVLGEGRYLRLLTRKSWEFVQRPNASAVVVIASVNRKGEAIFVEQHREALQQSVIEWPAGLVGDHPGGEDEPFETAAARELEEETGYRAGSIIVASQGPASSGMSDEITVILIAKDLDKVGDGGGVGGENITVHLISLTRAHDWLEAQIAEGKLVDPKVFAGLYFLDRSLASSKS